MLQVTEDPDVLGKIRWELAACMCIVWTVVYFKLWKSTKSSGRVLHLTATLPFVMLAVLLVRSLMLDGADIGLDYFLFKLRWELLLDSKVRVGGGDVRVRVRTHNILLNTEVDTWLGTTWVTYCTTQYGYNAVGNETGDRKKSKLGRGMVLI